MSEDIKLSLGFIILVVGFLINVYGFWKNSKKDTKQEVGETNAIHEAILKANLKLDSLCATTNEIRTDIKCMQTKINDMDKEISILKRDLETAFMRIDELKQEVYKNE